MIREDIKEKVDSLSAARFTVRQRRGERGINRARGHPPARRTPGHKTRPRSVSDPIPQLEHARKTMARSIMFDRVDCHNSRRHQREKGGLSARFIMVGSRVSIFYREDVRVLLRGK